MAEIPGLRYAVVFLFLTSAAAFVQASPPSEPGVSLEDPVYSTEDAFCQAYYEDSENENGDIYVNWRVGGAEVYTQTFKDIPSGSTVDSYLDAGNYTYDQGLVCEVVAENSDGTNTSMDDTLVQTAVPEIVDGPNFHNYTDQHEFNVSAVVSDDEGIDDMETCWIEAEASSNSIYREMELRTSYGDDTQARCFYSSIGEDSFNVLEEVNVTVKLDDTVSNVGKNSANNTVPNSEPQIFDVRPEDDSRTSGSEVTLQANFLDSDGETIDVRFYSSQASPETICTRTLDQGTVQCEWEGIDSLQDYQWRIDASDGYETVSMPFNFRNIVSSQVRMQTAFNHRYDSVVTTTGTSQVIRYHVSNTHDEVKSLTSTVEGLNAEFLNDEINSNCLDQDCAYELSPGEMKELDIRFQPEASGKFILNVTTVNEEFEINSKNSMEVFVRNADRTTASVPGIGFLQLAVLLMFSTLYYSVRL
ncbi:hypothetical protein ACK3SF_03795 [Candidatus Nanosalina sp. VS9-1]|uniref:hypothetical protein n=1 Tax=Candidatus Nanosalina sp. VS9-1 TaxID=3388566 RepID=UPI0039E1D166